MKILLHSPLHPSYWIYLMECMLEHEWFIEDKEDFEEGQIPRNHVWYSIISKDNKVPFDAQVIFLPQFLDVKKICKLVEEFPIPPVFLSLENQSLPHFQVKYPCISGTTFCYPVYPNIRFCYVPPSKTLWNKEWIGDKPQVFIPAQRYLDPEYSHSKMAQIVPLLEQSGISLDIARGKRTIPFNEWQDKFIHDRVLFDCSQKYASFVVEEAMMIGMPIVTLNINENAVMIRDKIDGYTNWTDKQLIELLTKFTTNRNFANKWSINSKRRGKEILNPKTTNKIWNEAFHDSVKLFKNSTDPFKLEDKGVIR